MTLAETVSSIDVDGTRIVLAERGSGPHLVLLHGMFGDHLDWELVMEPLSRHFHVVALDLPGFGASGKPRVEYTAGFFLSMFEGLFAALGMERILLAGHSFGGQLAVLYTLLHPAQVGKLVLVNSGGFRPISRDEREHTLHAFSESNVRSMNWLSIQYLFAPAFAHESLAKSRYLERQTSRLRTQDFPAYAHATAQAIEVSLTTYVFDKLREILCPTLLLWGDQDSVCPVEQGRGGLAQLRAGKLRVLPGCGHIPQLEAPEAFAAAAIPFLLADNEDRL